MLNIIRLMSELSIERPVFHSEADFQHALAIKLQQKFENLYSIRLERRISVNNDNFYVDIFMIGMGENKSIAIELKYKTSKLIFTKDQEDFLLKDQSANDLGRYHFREDIYWLEKLKEQHTIEKGFAIFLTNDQKYWDFPAHLSNNINDKEFRIHENSIITKEANWVGNADWTEKHGPLKLAKEYVCKWDDYSSLGTDQNQKFRFLFLEI